MATYAKLTENKELEILSFIPGVTNPSEAIIKSYATSNGYYPVTYVNSPGEWYNCSWKQLKASIKQVWKEWDDIEKIPVIQNNIQVLLDSTAAERNYDNIFTALTYLDSKNPKFKTEAEALRDWRDELWTECYSYLAKVESGEIKIPDNWKEVLEVLPKFKWPE